MQQTHLCAQHSPTQKTWRQAITGQIKTTTIPARPAVAVGILSTTLVALSSRKKPSALSPSASWGEPDYADILSRSPDMLDRKYDFTPKGRSEANKLALEPAKD